MVKKVIQANNERKSKALSALYEAIDQTNLVLSKAMQLEKSPKTVIIGDSGKLDSLGYINFMVAVQSKALETFDISIDVTNQDILLQNSLLTIDTLADYICSQLIERDNENI